MTRTGDANAPGPTAMTGSHSRTDNPWGGGEINQQGGDEPGPAPPLRADPVDDDDGDGKSDSGTPAGEPKPPRGTPGGPRNPWQPKGEEPPRRSAGIEDIFRPLGKGGSGRGGSGQGGGGFPRLPFGDTRSWLPWAIAGVITLWLISTTTHQLASTQEGIVTTFGQYSRTIDSGINFTAPWPIQNVQITDVTSIRRNSIPDGEGEKLMLTSDQNLVDLSYLVRWSISDLKNYTFQLKDPDLTVREVAEAAMRASVAEVTLNDVMGGSGRAQIEQSMRARMQAILNAYHSGVLVQGVEIKKADPPAKVNADYQQVNAAQQDARRDQSKAQAYASQVIARAQGETAAFDKVYAQYKLAPDVTRRRMYYETMEKVLSANDKVVIEGNTTSYLPLPELRRRAAAADNATSAGGQ